MPPDKEITLELKSAPKSTNFWEDPVIEDIPNNLPQVLVDNGVPEPEIDALEERNSFAYMEEAYNELLDKYRVAEKNLEEKTITLDAYKDIIKLLK